MWCEKGHMVHLSKAELIAPEAKLEWFSREPARMSFAVSSSQTGTHTGAASWMYRSRNNGSWCSLATRHHKRMR
jgi:hypothetical protein